MHHGVFGLGLGLEHQVSVLKKRSCIKTFVVGLILDGSEQGSEGTPSQSCNTPMTEAN